VLNLGGKTAQLLPSASTAALITTDSRGGSPREQSVSADRPEPLVAPRVAPSLDAVSKDRQNGLDDHSVSAAVDAKHDHTRSYAAVVAGSEETAATQAGSALERSGASPDHAADLESPHPSNSAAGSGGAGGTSDGEILFERGRTYAVIGQNRSGKSTLVKILCMCAC